ncbi:uncharacterized protein NEMAJ01_1608 [Nematocida major]|uniref:uncharacterized protein n=1 Tax=Nematocida major TaxID=1912982 RepID=UPI002007F6D5|nr:uncharacterized protein NEMAJ01_1608 [Nematocida major]KAH9386712.1 hypothetical protein NEMAJ01_1608 [Nematocida major]
MNAKCYALMLAALAHCAHARVSFDEVIEMQSTEIRNSNSFINPRGPLCLLRGFVYSEQGHMHNKRFFSPEIETDYKVEPVGDVETTNKHTYTRKAQKDKLYPPAEGPALGSKPASTDYSAEYHRTLIEMFPSVDGHTLSVAVGRKDSFFQFLQRMPSNHAHYVLAALLLLSEGIDVPIETTQNEIALEIGSIKVGADLCKKATQVIKFFKDNKGKGKLPCTPEAFSTGDFLNTPQFLIQAYVFEYITSKSDALDFAACVHAILTSLPENDCKDVYNTCFVGSKDKAEEDELLRQLVQIQTKMKILQSFPFVSPSMLPAYTSVHACKRGQTEFLDETFSNCVETGLFALFCCLAHDPVQKEYDADAMLGEAKEGDKTEALRNFFGLLKSAISKLFGSRNTLQEWNNGAQALRAFFQKESVTPKQCATKETMQEWNRVVSGLQSEHIAYVRPSRNEVRSGIFNVLYVIAEVTGRLEEEKLRIRELAQMLEDSEIDEDFEDVFEKTQEYVAELFASLSVDKSLKVEFSGLKVDVRSDKKKDLYGKITLKCTDKDRVVEQGICLAFRPRHLTVTLCPCVFLSLTDEEKEAFFAVDGYSEPADFVECLLAKYADAWRARGTEYSKSKLIEDTREASERLAVDGASAHPNQLFLLGSALRYEQIQEFSENFTLHAAAKGTKLAQKHPAVRLLSNLLGSLPLDDNATQSTVLECPVCLDMLGKLFPRIALSKEIFADIYRSAYAIRTMKLYIRPEVDSAPAANAIMKYFREYKEQTREPFFRCHAVASFAAISDLFPVLLADKLMRHVDEIGALITDKEEKDRAKVLDAKATFDLLLFFASLKHNGTPLELMLALGSRVGPRLIQACSVTNCRFYINSQTASKILEALNAHWSALLQTPNGEEVFSGVQCILKSRIH